MAARITLGRNPPANHSRRRIILRGSAGTVAAVGRDGPLQSLQRSAGGRGYARCGPELPASQGKRAQDPEFGPVTPQGQCVA